MSKNQNYLQFDRQSYLIPTQNTNKRNIELYIY